MQRVMFLPMNLKYRIEMKPAARIERKSCIISQLLEGYGGYIYEVIDRWSGAELFQFAFRGDRWVFPEENHYGTGWDIVHGLNDGIYWLKNHGNGRPEYERYLQKR